MTGPLADGGLEIHTTKNEQGIQKITKLAGHMHQGGRASSMLHISLDWCQIIAGVSYPILRHPNKHVPHKERCWIINLRQFLKQNNLAIDLTTTWIEPTQREGDFHLMEKLGPPYSKLLSTRINYCRLWLRVSRLSDITHTDGKTLLKDALYGDQLHHRRSTLTWPRIPRPPQTFFTLWRKALLTLLSVDGKKTTLREPLGPWNTNRRLLEWQALYDPTTDQLLSRDTEWLNYRPHPPTGRTTTTNRSFGAPQQQIYVVPSDMAIPVMARKRHGNNYVITRPSPITIVTTEPTTISPDTFWEYVSQQHIIYQRLLFDIRVDEDTCVLISQRLECKQGIDIGTDGGVLFQTGAFTWVFDLTEVVRIRCGGPADGTTSDIDPKRAELYGILSVLTFLRFIVEYYTPDTTATLRIHCDEINTVNDIEAFRDINQHDAFVTTKRCCANYDIIAEILSCITDYPGKVSILHIKGHQDQKEEFDDLSIAAQLNCVAHDLCSQQLQKLIAAPSTYDNPGHFPKQQCSILHHHRRVTGPLQKRLKEICYTPAIEKYWKKRFTWRQIDIDNLDRKAFSRVFFSLTKPDQRRITQFRCGWLPVNKRCCKWMKDRTGICPCCQICESESVNHLLKCSHNKHHTGELYSSLQSSMEKAKFHTTIIECILDQVSRWFFPHDIHPEQHDSPPDCLQDAIDAQTDIGWGNFLRGFIATQWIDANAELYETRHDTPKAITLGAALIRPCLQFFLHRWIERNAALHGGTKEEREHKQQLLRNKRIDEYAEASRRLIPRDKKILFIHKPEAIKKLRPAQQKNWLAFAHVFLPPALQRCQARRTTGQTHITDHFVEIYNPNNRPVELDEHSLEEVSPEDVDEDYDEQGRQHTQHPDSDDDEDSYFSELEFGADDNNSANNSVTTLTDDALAQLSIAGILDAYFADSNNIIYSDTGPPSPTSETTEEAEF